MAQSPYGYDPSWGSGNFSINPGYGGGTAFGTNFGTPGSLSGSDPYQTGLGNFDTGGLRNAAASRQDTLDPQIQAAMDASAQADQAKIDAGNATVAASIAPDQLGPGSAEYHGQTGDFTAADWSAANQWSDDLLNASEYYGVPADRLKAQMLIESRGVMYDASGNVTTQVNPYGGNSYGLMQITPVASGQACSDEWCGWGDGSDLTKQTGVNHNIYTPDGNLMMGAYILRQQYEAAKAIYPNASEQQLWDMASSAFFTGNFLWDGGDSVNGNTGSGYKQDMDALMGIMAAPTGKVSGQAKGSTTDATVVPKGAATGNKLIDAAQSFLGSQYVLGAPYGTAGPGEPTYFDANGRPTAFDCSGFVAYLAKTELGVDISTGSHEQWNDAGRFLSPDEPMQPGDLLFFNTGSSYRAGNAASHVGIYIGTDEQGRPMMINALNEDEGVVVSYLDTDYWRSTFMGSKRLVG